MTSAAARRTFRFSRVPGVWGRMRASTEKPRQIPISPRRIQRLERSCYQKFDALMVNSEATGETLLREYAIDPERMSQVSLTVPPEPGEVAPEKLMGSPRLVFAGGNFYRKGLDVCLRALPELLLKFPTMMLHVVGTCRSEPSIRRLADRLDVAGSVRFHGQVEPRHVAGLLASADALVMPSRTEALGLVYLEAFRARVPVVAGDRGGVTEIVRDRRSGVVVSPDHPQMLAEGIDILLSNPELQRRVVQGGLEVLAERTPARLIEQTLAAYGLVREAGGADPADRRGLTTARS